VKSEVTWGILNVSQLTIIKIDKYSKLFIPIKVTS